MEGSPEPVQDGWAGLGRVLEPNDIRYRKQGRALTYGIRRGSKAAYHAEKGAQNHDSSGLELVTHPATFQNTQQCLNFLKGVLEWVSLKNQKILVLAPDILWAQGWSHVGVLERAFRERGAGQVRLNEGLGSGGGQRMQQVGL